MEILAFLFLFDASATVSLDLTTARGRAQFRCTMNRLGAPIGSGAHECPPRPPLATSGSIGDLTRTFCSGDGHAYCTAIRALRATDSFWEVLSPRCEAPVSWDTTVATGHDDPFGSEAMASFSRSAWGCLGSLETARGPSGAGEFRRVYRCEASRMPARCEVGPFSSTVDPAFQAITFAANARRDGDQCVLTLSERPASPGAAGPPLPAPDTGENLEDYFGRLTPDQRTEAQRRTSALDAQDRDFFSNAANTLAHNEPILREGARSFFNAGRMARVQSAFASAMTGVRAYLSSLYGGGPLPPEVEEILGRTRMADPAALWRQPQLPDDQTVALRWRNLCGGNTADEANAPVIGPGGMSREIVICPAAILEAEDGNFDSIIPILAHEIGHSLDPCGQGLMTVDHSTAAGPQSRHDCNTPRRTPSAAMSSFTSATDAYMACLASPAPLPSGSPPPRVMARRDTGSADAVLDAMTAESYLSPRRRCELALHRTGGIWERCESAFDPTESPNPRRFPRSAAALSAYQADILDQGQETFADSIAAGASAFALRAAAGGDLAPGEAQAQAITSISSGCFYMNDTDTADHASDGYRMSVLEASDGLREMVGCGGLAPPVARQATGPRICTFDPTP